MTAAPAIRQLPAEDMRRGKPSPVETYLAGLATRSRQTVEGRLERFARTLTAGGVGAWELPWWELRAFHLAVVQRKLQDTLAPSTVNYIIAAVRSLLRECWRHGLLEAEELARAVDVRGLKAPRSPAGRALEPGEIAALFATCRDTGGAAGPRDAALIAVAFGGGLRRAELVALDLEGYQDGSLVVRGKGGKLRRVPLPAGARRALAEWLAVRGQEPGALFLPVTPGRSGHPIHGRRLCAQVVYDMLRRRAARAGLQSFSPHDLRRSYCSELLDRGADLSHVQQLMGHANVATTTIYDRRPEAARRKTAELLSVPF